MMEMASSIFNSPVSFLHTMLGDMRESPALRDFETWWEATGMAISTAVDHAGTPWVKVYDGRGERVDQIMLPPDYRHMLNTGYKAGVVWRAFEQDIVTALQFSYVSSYYDMGASCPYTVSLATAAAVDKYAPSSVRDDFLGSLLLRDDAVWQGATWMTEIGGGSDLGASVKTRATLNDAKNGQWRLNGEKYFCSNANAELAVVAARTDDAPDGVRGLSLFLVPRYRDDGSLNVYLRRMKDKIATRSVPTGEIDFVNSEAYLLGEAHYGIYLIMEVLNLSRVCNAIGSIAVAQRALRDAYTFAKSRQVFGKALIDQPLMRRQFAEREAGLRQGFALAWEAAQLLQAVWREPAPNYSETFHLCRLVIHLAKYWTAEFAVQTAKWAMEVNGGIGTLQEFGVERWLREAMIADIWEGPPHRQMLDGLEVMERKKAHHLLLDSLAPYCEGDDLADMRARLDDHLLLPQDEKEAGMLDIFPALAAFAGEALVRKMSGERIPA
jgi:alkylation response protein AidB-like acyl-CoA dehydrogenase